MTQFFSSYRNLLITALLVRIIAAIFSPGYGMVDDHFLIVEAAGSWVDGFDYNHWFPWSPRSNGIPQGHSYTYTGLNWILFEILNFFGIKNPSTWMYIDRILHALLSMLVVVYSFKITEKLSNRKNAFAVGWIIGLLWLMPFLSVRNLVEVAVLPFLLWGTWLLLKNQGKSTDFWAGILVGFAISFRYQLALLSFGFVVVLLFKKEWKKAFWFCIGNALIFSLTQGLVDFLIWGYPFAEFLAYFIYNSNQGTTYMPNSNYFMYFFVLMGACLVPLGVLLMIGFLRSWRKYTLLFLPTMLFLLFHTFYPNRQERFILSVLPFFIILGSIGFSEINKRMAQKWWKGSIIAFWILNIPLLAIATTMYTKKSRVESMHSIYNDKIEQEWILVEGTGSGRIYLLPKFYARSWNCHMIDRSDPTSPLIENPQYGYDYIFFLDKKNIKQRIAAYKKEFPKMQLHKKCEASFVDDILFKLNPRNANEYIEVWKTNQK
ncbi:MAG: hypothetical protein V4638_02210 [Bacteroidota bacterium]